MQNFDISVLGCENISSEHLKGILDCYFEVITGQNSAVTIVENFNSLQQLKAEIAAIATSFDQLGPGSCGGEQLKKFYELVIKLRQLSAV